MSNRSTMEHLAQFTLVRATPEQLSVSRTRQAISWTKGMTKEEFFRREELLDVQEHAGDKFIAWALVPRDNTKTLDFPCSCETFRRKVLVATSGVIQLKIGYGIASVYCGPEHRGKGYASYMMRLLHYALAPPYAIPAFPKEYGAPLAPEFVLHDAQLSVLYSDVGEFYSQLGPLPNSPGWITKDPISIIWKMDFITGVVPKSTDVSFEWLTEEKCKELWVSDSAYIKEKLESMASEEPNSSAVFTFLPDEGVAGYLLQRTICEAPLFPSDQQVPLHFGVRLVPKEMVSPNVYATWTLDMELSKQPVIVLTRLRSTVKHFSDLIGQIMTEASRINAKAIEVWNLSPELVDIAANMGGRSKPRVDHLPAVAWYGSEGQSVKWIFNEKFAWC